MVYSKLVRVELGSSRWNLQLSNPALKAANTRESSSNNTMFSKTEIEWFFQNACILALENIAFPHSQQIQQLFDVSTKVWAFDNWECNIMPNDIQFATIYQQGDLDAEEQTNILSHHLLCCYLRSLKIVSEARRQRGGNEKVPQPSVTIYIKPAIKLTKPEDQIWNHSCSCPILPRGNLISTKQRKNHRQGTHSMGGKVPGDALLWLRNGHLPQKMEQTAISNRRSSAHNNR